MGRAVRVRPTLRSSPQPGSAVLRSHSHARAVLTANYRGRHGRLMGSVARQVRPSGTARRPLRQSRACSPATARRPLRQSRACSPAVRRCCQQRLSDPDGGPRRKLSVDGTFQSASRRRAGPHRCAPVRRAAPTRAGQVAGQRHSGVQGIHRRRRAALRVWTPRRLLVYRSCPGYAGTPGRRAGPAGGPESGRQRAPGGACSLAARRPGRPRTARPVINRQAARRCGCQGRGTVRPRM